MLAKTLREPSQLKSCTASWALLLALVAAPAQSQTGAQPPVTLEISAGKLTLEAHNAALGDVLQRVARALDARLSIPAELAARRGYWKLREVRVADAVAQIAHPSSVVFAAGEIHVFAGERADAAQTPGAAPRPASRVAEMSRVLAKDPDAAARRAAAAELGAMGAEEGVKALEDALSDADADVRFAAVDALGSIGSDEALRLVSQAAMATADPEVRAAALRLLEASDSELARTLVPAIRARRQGR